MRQTQLAMFSEVAPKLFLHMVTFASSHDYADCSSGQMIAAGNDAHWNTDATLQGRLKAGGSVAAIEGRIICVSLLMVSFHGLSRSAA